MMHKHEIYHGLDIFRPATDPPSQAKCDCDDPSGGYHCPFHDPFGYAADSTPKHVRMGA